MPDLLLQAGMLFYQYRHWRPVERLTRQPDVAQLSVLRHLLNTNRDTRFGVEYGFESIRTPAQFQERVPVQDYEKLRPYIEDQRTTGSRALTAEAPLFYAQTSGSTGVPKFIPITPSMLAMQKAEQALFSYLQFRACPMAFAGKAFGIMGAAVEGHLDSGHTVGSVSGHLYRSLPQSIRARFVIPAEVSEITDYDVKYLVIVCLALMEPDITYIGSPNPSTFLRLLDILNTCRDRLLTAVANGTLDVVETLDPPIRKAVVRRLKRSPDRAARLRREATLTYANVWPGIRLVTTWTGGSCGIALETLRGKLPPGASVMELGYQSTECRGTIALDAGTTSGLPPLHHSFFEFVEPADWDRGSPSFLTLDQLRAGTRYYILVTTASGLYRYFMNDLVEVTGFFYRTPLLRFVQKGKGVTNLTGEKVYEAQIIEAVKDAGLAQRLASPFFLMIADEQRCSYQLFIESAAAAGPSINPQVLAIAIDRRLGELNIEYHAKRESGRLGPLSVTWLRPGSAEAYKVACVSAGQREGQFKPAVLQYGRDLLLALDDHVVP